MTVASILLGLKLLLVPVFLGLLTLAGRYMGPAVLGCLAGLPLVSGPISLILAVEQGAGFATGASVATVTAVVAATGFGLAYAHAAQRHGWPVALAAGVAAWLAAAASMAWLSLPLLPALCLALAALTLGCRCFPRVAVQSVAAHGRSQLPIRMAAGTVLTLVVTQAAMHLGSTWSGLFALFPMLGSLLAVFSHRHGGAGFAAALLQGMTRGMFALVAFFTALALLLPQRTIAESFALALLACLLVQRMAMRRSPRATAAAATTS